MIRPSTLAALAALLTAGAALAQPAPQAAPDRPPWKPYATPNLVRLPDGRRMNLICMGSGSPTVILENGLGASAWGLVQYKIARTTRTCSYDRAGMGFSDEGPALRDAAAVAADLDALLHAARIEGPYVLVGHSLGGYFVRLYAELHPKSLAGIVLIDPSIDDQARRLKAVVPRIAPAGPGNQPDPIARCGAAAEAGELKPESDIYKACVPNPPASYAPEYRAALIAPYLKPGMYRTLKSEAGALDRDSDEVKAHRRTFGDLPLIVLTAGSNPDPGLTEAENQAWAREWSRAHDDIAAASSRGQNRTVQGSGHYIQIQQPQVVIDAVTEVVGEARRRAGAH
jgi:pimeloyl-ACP methyl ester carboxylesterase